MSERLDAFTVREDPKSHKNYWTKIGAAWPTKNGGWSIRLDALPCNGQIVLQPPREREPGSDDFGG